MPANDIAQKVREAGIVGAGGAGFPTHVKFESSVDTVIANGAECEPLLSCDKTVMRERTNQVLRGLSLLAEATSAERIVLALKGKYRDVVERVQDVARQDFPRVEVFELENFYPAGDEQVLVQEVTGRVVPEGGIPLQVGAVVDNIITLAQACQAVDQGRPVTRRALTVSGRVQRPLTCQLPIGAPMSLALELAGGATVQDWVIIEGGPMMGEVVRDPRQPITKKTSGVLVFERDHPLVQRKLRSMDREVSIGRAVCCQCRMCTDLCPRYLLGHAIHPHLVMRSMVTEGISEPPPEHITAAFLCCLCGACEAYSCPLGLSPRKVYNSMLQALWQAGVSNPHQRQDTATHEFRKHRKIPLPRLAARLGIEELMHVPHAVALGHDHIPSEVRILLSQHIGAPSLPVVEKGQVVNEGDLVAEIPEGKLGARQHASINGTVVEVGPHDIRIERT